MKRKLFLYIALLLLAAILLSGAAAFTMLRPQLSAADFWDGDLPAALWTFPGLVIAAAAAAWLVAHRITAPIGRIDPELPGETAPYEELEPLMARIRAQDRELRRQSEEMGRARRDFEAITENMAESFLVLDRRLNVVSRNVSAQHLLPPPTDGMPDNLMRCTWPEEILRSAEKALVGHRTELTLPLHGRYYQFIVTPVFSDTQITGAVIIAMDTTEREEREALRREFSANVSHELKTPLTSIIGFAELIKSGMVPPEKTGEFAGDIHKEARRMVALVDDILELSRLEDDTAPPEREPVDLYALAGEVLESLEPLAESSQVTLSLEGESTVIPGVRTALEEMIHNLCDNAVKYNRPGGAVTVTVDAEGKERRLTVADTGIGIPFEHQSRVFERFYRVDKSHSRDLGGTGLGLSIVRHAAQLHRARLELRSTPGVGTTITVRFPRETEE